MSAGLLKTIALSVATACTVPTAFAADLTAGAVAAPDQYGAKVAAHILQAGGNAVDAAVATAFTPRSPTLKPAISAAAAL